MARKTVVHWIDDLDGGDAAGTVTFGLDRVDYEIDLSEDNATALRDALADYIARARRQPRSPGRGARSGRSAGARRGARPSSSSREQSTAIREWARRHGYTVGDRGRLPAEVTEAYHRRGGTQDTDPSPTTPAPVAAAANGAGSNGAAAGAGSAAVGLDGLTVEDREHIRAWAQQEGIDVKPRGRLRRDLIANYRATMARLGA